MLKTLFFYSTIGLIAALSIVEIRRYRAAQYDPDAMAYTRRRLSRRLGIAVLILAAMLGAAYRPASLGPYVSLLWLGACLFAMVLVFVLTWRDLRETSVMVVREHQKFEAESSAEFREAGEKKSSKKNGG